MARFLAKFPLQSVVMEATGVYSTPVRDALEGFDGWAPRPLIITFNPTDAKHFPGELHEDKADAFAMARFALMGLLRPSFIPEGVIREMREFTRAADVFTKECTRAKIRIKQVLAAWGLSLPRLKLDTSWSLDLFRAIDWASGNFGKAVSAIRSGEFPTSSTTCTALAKREADYAPFGTVVLPSSAQVVLHSYVLILAAFGALYAQVEGEVGELVGNHPAIERVVNQIASVDGITAITAASIVAEIGDISRFPTAKHFLAYAGCAPTVHQSGTKVARGHLTKRANLHLKLKFIWAGKTIATILKGESEIKNYAKIQFQKHPSKMQKKLVWASVGAKVARVVFALLHTNQLYEASPNKDAILSDSTDLPQAKSTMASSIRELRKRSRQFVNYLNRFQAEAPEKFNAVAEAFGKITWA